MNTDIEQIDDEFESSDELYPLPDDIDFGKIYATCRDLCFFDDLYLGMQAMNIGIVDMSITQWEYGLLRRYIEIEKTPLDDCMFVSAQSQMWIFAVYELLRTWRGRIKKFIKWSESGGLQPFIEKNEGERMNPAASIQARQARHLLENPSYRDVMEGHMKAMELPFEIADSIRMNLAKHEVPGKPNHVALAPGYGRINMMCGAMDFQINLRGGEFTILNRRDLAEALRAVNIDSETGK